MSGKREVLPLFVRGIHLPFSTIFYKNNLCNRDVCRYIYVFSILNLEYNKYTSIINVPMLGSSFYLGRRNCNQQTLGYKLDQLTRQFKIKIVSLMPKRYRNKVVTLYAFVKNSHM
jgi:hypothetical protein